jgi:hypothetical protein
VHGPCTIIWACTVVYRDLYSTFTEGFHTYRYLAKFWQISLVTGGLFIALSSTASKCQKRLHCQRLSIHLRRKLGSESVKTQFSKIYFLWMHFYRSHELTRPTSSYLCLSNTTNLVLIECPMFMVGDPNIWANINRLGTSKSTAIFNYLQQHQFTSDIDVFYTIISAFSRSF